MNALIGSKVVGSGIGRTKKAAEQMAAYQGIIKLKNDEKKQGNRS